MNVTIVLVWGAYALLILFFSMLGRSKNALLPGKVGVVIQSLAYVATYISAVALIGFAGLGHSMGLQILIIAAGNIWLGVWFVYKYIAWPTRLMQKKTGALTPIELLSKGYKSQELGKFMGLLSGVFILVYCSAVFKGGAAMLTSAIPIKETHALWLLVGLVGVSVLWGGLRAVLYTEAFQGLIMAAGVITLVGGALYSLGGPVSALKALSEIPPTPQANNGLLAVSSGYHGMNIVFLTLVTSVGMWAQPQVIQRHFALKSREQALKVIPIAMLILSLLLGGAYFVGGISRLIIGPEISSPDAVIPTLVRIILPEFGVQLFTLAIVSAALSTASALLHVSCATIGHDVLGRRLDGNRWRVAVVLGALLSGFFAVKSSSIIALICSTSWTLIAAALWVPYLVLISSKQAVTAKAGWAATLSGTFGAIAWYGLAYKPTATAFLGISAPGFLGDIHPMLVGILCSGMGMLAGRAQRVAALSV